MKHSQVLKSFYGTKPLPCSYLKGKMEAKMAAEIGGPDAQEWANMLSRAGFRRSHSVYYIPSCPDCNACVSGRVLAAEFRPDKKMKQILRRNAHLKISFSPNVATTEQYELFAAYLAGRHADSEMASMYFEEYRAMVEDAPVDCLLMEVRDEENGKLLGAMLIDVLDDGLSAVYSFFDISMSRQSLGTFMILKLIESAAGQGMPYVYLGYMISGISNMGYKWKFVPLEYCKNGEWIRADSLADQV